MHLTRPARLVYREACGASRANEKTLAREADHARRCPKASPECACLRDAMRILEAEILRQTGQHDLEADTVVSYHFGEGIDAQTYFRDKMIAALFNDPADAAFVRKLSNMSVLDVSALPADTLRRFHARLALASCAAHHIRVSREPDPARDAFLVNTVSAVSQHIGGGIELGEMLNPIVAAA